MRLARFALAAVPAVLAGLTTNAMALENQAVDVKKGYPYYGAD